MLLKLSSNTCSLCEDTDVSLSEGDTKQYVRFIKDALGNDSDWENSKSFRVCLLCTHSLDLLKEIIAGIEKHTVKSCFCCKSTSNLFKHSDLPHHHRENVTAFASTFSLSGLNMCLHCFYAVNFWVKLTSYLDSSKQKSNSSTQNSSSTRSSGNESPRKTPSKVYNNSDTFAMPRGALKLPEIMQQVKKIKMMQNKMNRTTIRKFSSDNKLVARVPFVFLSRISHTNHITPTIEISDDNEFSSSTTPIRSSRFKKKAVSSPAKGKATRLRAQSIRKSHSESDSDDVSNTPVRNFRNRPLKIVLSPLKNKQIRSKSNLSNGDVEASPKSKNKKLSKTKKKLTPTTYNTDDSDNNDYSVSSNGSNNGIVIKRVSRTSKSKSAAKQKLATSPLRTIRIQAKKTNTSSSSDNADVSPITSTPRSPITLPPKKNRKRIMDLSDSEYFEPIPIEKRPTRGAKDKKQPLIDPDSQDSQDSEIPKAKYTIDLSSDDESTKEDNGKDSTNKELNSPKTGAVNRVGTEDSLDDLSFIANKDNLPQDTNEDDETAKDNVESQPTIDKIVAKYLDEDDSTINKSKAVDVIQHSDSEDTDLEPMKTKDTDAVEINENNENTSEEVVEKDKNNEESNPKDAAEDADQINFDASLISPNADTLDLLKCLNDEISNEDEAGGKDEDTVQRDEELNLQLTPEPSKNAVAEANDTEQIVLISNAQENDSDLFTLDTQIISHGDDGESTTTKMSSQSSNYQDADDNAGKIVTVLQDISFTEEPSTNPAATDPLELDDNATSPNLDADNANSLITEDESEDNSNKRKRNSDDSMDSNEGDDTPRTKRVRFAAEKEVLNEDDTVCLEDFEANENDEPHEEAAPAQENNEDVDATESENLASLAL